MSTAFEHRLRRRRVVAFAALAFSVAALAITVIGLWSPGAEAQNVRPPENAEPAAGVDTDGLGVPGGAQGIRSDADLWRYVRGHADPDFDATSSNPNPQAKVLVQSQGEDWRNFRNGPLPRYGVYGLAGMLALIAVFYLIRGRIRIDHGRAGATVERFNGFERFGHWLLASSFIVLALSGLNLLYGRFFLPDLIGKPAFASLSAAGKWAHNNVAWAFMLGLVIVFLMWVRHNLPSLLDVKWVLKGGGLLVKGVHPDSRKFNAGQKIVFWATILLGLSISMSGIALLFPFETALMSKTFVALNSFGWDLPTQVSAMREQQYQSEWHAIVGLAMIAVIIAHIYIGTLGMEGAFAAMGSGQVDVNWAKEHHNLWLEEVRAAETEAPAGAAATPAE